jgi:hypothetical protein
LSITIDGLPEVAGSTLKIYLLYVDPKISEEDSATDVKLVTKLPIVQFCVEAEKLPV